MGIEELLGRLEAIAGEIDDLAFDRLQAASSAAREKKTIESSLVTQEKQLSRARRAIEKALTELRKLEAVDS